MDDTVPLSVLTLDAPLDPADSAANERTLDRLVAEAGPPPGPAARAIVLLPERWWRDRDVGPYGEAVVRMARRWGFWVVGGTLHARTDDGVVNVGRVIRPDGTVAAEYTKRHPFAGEAFAGVRAGAGPSLVEIAGVPARVVVCADLFDPALFPAGDPPCDAIFVCAASTSRKAAPDFARALWSHLAVARAWEHNAFVAIGDWAHRPHLPGVRTCGVGGLADPTREEPPLFLPNPGAAAWRRLDRAALRRLDRDRRARNFLWTPPPVADPSAERT
jgi:predicted amidohydrolase